MANKLMINMEPETSKNYIQYWKFEGIRYLFSANLFRVVSQIIDMVKKNKMYVTCFCSFTQNIGFLIDDWYTMGLPWKTFCALIEWIQLP